MGQLDFPSLQQTQVDLIDAKPYFSAIEVLNDDGNQQAALEAALRDKGAAVLVCPVLSGNRGSQQTHALSFRAENVVKLFVNPKRNADTGGAELEVLEGIRQILIAVLGYQRRPGEQFWGVTEEVFTLNTFDPGLWVYDIFFIKDFTIPIAT